MMMEKNKLTNWLPQKGVSLFAICVLACATLSANTACGIPYFEPEPPKELKRLKKSNMKCF